MMKLFFKDHLIWFLLLFVLFLWMNLLFVLDTGLPYIWGPVRKMRIYNVKEKWTQNKSMP